MAKQPSRSSVGPHDDAAALRAKLAEVGLSAFADGVIAQGYDTLGMVRAMEDDELSDVASALGMGLGHKKKLRRSRL